MANATKSFALGVAFAAAGIIAVIAWAASQASATPPKPAKPATAAAAEPSRASSLPNDAGPSTPPATTQIEFTTVPLTHATVTWGSAVLGHIAPHKPLVVVRPRDSGPLDVTVHAHGFLPVHTRAQTFEDSKVAVKLTRIDEKNTLFGYREPLDAGLPDGATAPPQAGAATPPTQPVIPQAQPYVPKPQAPQPAPH